MLCIILKGMDLTYGREQKYKFYIESFGNKHNARTLLVANMSTEHLGNCGVNFYQTDLLGKPCTGCAITHFYHHKIKLIFTVFAITIFGNVKSTITFSIPRINLLSIQFTCL